MTTARSSRASFGSAIRGSESTSSGASPGGLLWLDPLIELNPSFEPGESIDDLVEEGVLHSECARIFRVDKAGTQGAAH